MRTLWLFVSATKSFPWWARPPGSWNSASAAAPSVRPGLPVPAKVRTAPRASFDVAEVDGLHLVVVRVGDVEDLVHHRDPQRMLERLLRAPSRPRRRSERGSREREAPHQGRDGPLSRSRSERSSIPSRPHGGLPSTREPRWLRERGILEGPIRLPLGSIARERADGPLPHVEPPNLVRAGHGDEHLVAADVEVPGRAQGGFARWERSASLVALLPGPRHRADHSRAQVHLADRVVFGVRRGGSRHGTRSPAASGTALPSRVHPRSRGSPTRSCARTCRRVS